MANLQSQIAIVKQLDLIEVMAGFKIIFRKGSNQHIRCPFPAHQATGITPSFSVYEETNSFFCWGCKKAGSPIDFVMGMTQSSFVDAIKYLVKKFNVKVDSSLLTKVIAKSVFNKNKFVKSFNLIESVKKIGQDGLKGDDRIQAVEDLIFSIMV